MKNKKTKGASSDEAQSAPAKMGTVPKIINIVVQFTVMAIAAFIIYRTVQSTGFVLYSLHPILHSIGYLILMSHGILVIADNNVSTLGYKYSERVRIHWLLQGVALILITTAQAAIYNNKENFGYPHFQSIHSFFGLATFGLTVSATLGGVLTKYSSKVKIVKPSMLKLGHGFAGVFVYIMAMCTIYLGLNQTLVEESDSQLKLAILLAFIVTSIYIVRKSVKSRLSKKKD